MIEIQRNDDGTLDEITARDCSFQLEQMNVGSWFLYIRDETQEVRLTLYAPRVSWFLAESPKVLASPVIVEPVEQEVKHG